MKRYIVIGLGTFGATLAERLHQLGQEVIAIDTKADLVDAVGPKVSRAIVGDASNKVVLDEAGARQADCAVVSTGDDMASSILALLALKDLEVEAIFVKVRSEEHSRIVAALGAKEIIFPERESALGLASKVTAGALLQYVRLGSKLSIQEMAVPETWRGKTLRELALPQNFQVQVVAVHDVVRDEMTVVPRPDRRLDVSDALLVAGEPVVLERLTRVK